MSRRPEEPIAPETLIAHRVRERFVRSQKGQERCALSVHCEPREQSLDLRECGRCVHFGHIETHGSELVMLCRPPGGGLAFSHVPVSAAMAHQVHCLDAGLDCAAGAAYLALHGLAQAPVVSDGGRFVGMVRQHDLLAARADAPVAALALTPLPPISEHAPLARAAARMAHERVSVLAVVDNQGLLVGILRALDIVASWAKSEGYVLGHEPSDRE